MTGIAAVISYGHAYQLVTRYGESGAIARALPLTVDGLIATCSLVILHYARNNRRAPWHAWGLLFTGVIATVGANVAHGLDHGAVGATVAGWPALVAVGSFELLIRLMRDQPKPPAPAGFAEAEENVPQLDDAGETHDTTDGHDPDVLAAIDLYTPALQAGELPSIRRIKRDLRVGHPKAARIHHALREANTPTETGEPHPGPALTTVNQGEDA